MSSVTMATAEAGAILKDLIRLKSAMSPAAGFTVPTAPALDYVAKYLRQEVGAELYYTDFYEYPVNSGIKHRSLVGLVKAKSPGNKPPLIFFTDIDTVPVPPDVQGNLYEPREINGKIYGRGAADMKGQLACLLAGLKFRAADKDIVVVTVAGEEVLAGTEQACELLQKLRIPVENVIVTEATNGYLGNGCKGYHEGRIEISASGKAGEYWDKCFKITTKSEGGHSSLQGATPADPALAITKIFAAVESLRKWGLKLEICQVKYGFTPTIIGGEAEITIGYQDIFSRELMRAYLFLKQPVSNFMLLVMTILSNLYSLIIGEVSGMNFGKIDFGYKKAADEKYPHTLENGNAIEAAIKSAGLIYDLNSRQRKAGRAHGYAIPALGAIKLGIGMLNGTGASAELVFDAYYPKEAVSGQDTVPVFAKALQDIDEFISKLPLVEARRKTVIEAAPFSTPVDKNAQGFVDALKASGLGRYRSASTLLPYTSDGNIIAQKFPEARIFLIGPGGFENNAHGKNENMEIREMGLFIDFLSRILSASAKSIDGYAKI